MNIRLLKIDGPGERTTLKPNISWQINNNLPPNFQVDIIFINIKTGERFLFQKIDYGTGAFEPPYNLPGGYYEVKLMGSETVSILSNSKRFYISDRGEERIENFNINRQVPVAVKPIGKIELYGKVEDIVFQWDFDDDNCICFDVLIRDDVTNKVLLRKKGIPPEERCTSFDIKEFAFYHGKKLYWIVKAIYFSRDYISKRSLFTIDSGLKTYNNQLDKRRKTTKIVKLRNVGVSFQKGLSSKNDTFLRNIGNILPYRKRRDVFWALQDISFTLKEGEILGVIGNNGAGKSTLLKVLNSVLFPDVGSIEINGKVSALLSLGAGFLPNLTGRENIIINATYLGLSKPEILNLFDEIVEFAELGDFIDTQIKYYSSGMKARLGFSVAVHIEPEILIVDEVLGAGDKNFRKKAELKMVEFMASAKALIIASHSMNIISNITTKCILLEKGHIIAYGPTFGVIEQYLNG